jgi:hypothetical protein
MRMAGFCAGVAFAALALQAQTGVERVTVPFSDASRLRILRVSLLSGSITVAGRAGNEAAVESRGRAGRQRGVKVEERDNTVTVSSGPEPVDLVIQVPFDAALRLKTVNGGTAVEGISGEIEAEAVNGAIVLKNVSGAVVAHSLNSGVTVVFDKAPPDKAMSFSTMNGNVDVTMPAGAKARVKMKTGNGEIRSDFDIQLQPEPGPTGAPRTRLNKAISGTINGGGAEMQFTTFNGTIYLRRKE